MKTVRLIGLATCAAAVLLAPSAHAGDASFKSFDRPLAIQDIKPKSSDAPGSEVVCTWYTDLMVRETGTDTPWPGKASLIPIRQGAAKPACERAPAAGAITLRTEGYALAARKGGFLIWVLSNPNGAEPFTVMSAATGRILFTDATSPTLSSRWNARLTAGVLHLAYTRAYNAPCSLLQDGRRCWASLKVAGVVPKATSALSPIQTSCRAAYNGSTASDPSVVVFNTEVSVSAAGKHKTLSRGQMGCLPLP
jgi:hypothetical protein